MDLIDLPELAASNHGIRYLINFVDVMSKYVWSYPTIRKSTESIYNVFWRWLADLERMGVNLEPGGPKLILQSDNGSEFINHEIKDLMEANNFKQMFSRSHTPQSNGAVERFNQTLKRTIYSYISQFRTRKYLDQLSTLIGNYNTQYHSSIGTSPAAIVAFAHSSQSSDQEKLANIGDKLKAQAKKTLMKQRRIFHGDEEVLEIGQKVRIALEALFPHIRAQRRSKVGVWAKSYTQQWSHEVFTITSKRKWQDKQYIYQVESPEMNKVEWWPTRKQTWWKRQDLDLVPIYTHSAPSAVNLKPVQEVLYTTPLARIPAQLEEMKLDKRQPKLPKKLEEYVLAVPKHIEENRQVLQPTEEQEQRLDQQQADDEQQLELNRTRRTKRPTEEQLSQPPIPPKQIDQLTNIANTLRRSVRKRKANVQGYMYH